MIKPNCRKCKKELTQYGAILLSPPDELSMTLVNDLQMIVKSHLCKECYKIVTNLIDQREERFP